MWLWACVMIDLTGSILLCPRPTIHPLSHYCVVWGTAIQRIAVQGMVGLGHRGPTQKTNVTWSFLWRYDVCFCSNFQIMCFIFAEKHTKQQNIRGTVVQGVAVWGIAWQCVSDTGHNGWTLVWPVWSTNLYIRVGCFWNEMFKLFLWWWQPP